MTYGGDVLRKVNQMYETMSVSEYDDLYDEFFKGINMEKLYFRMYQGVSYMNGRSVIVSPEKMNDEIYAAKNYDIDMPVFEPVFMSEEEFNALPEFDGF